MKNVDKVIVLFVEGDTEEEFYKLLIKYYRENTVNSFPEIKIFNLKGIGRFEGKVVSKLKNDILKNKKYKDLDIKVFCCYDTDVFELGKKPPTNWTKVKKQVKDLGIKSFNEIQSQKMIEDWFVLDMEGVCEYLGIPVSKKKFSSGLITLKELFKSCKKPKIYQKGSYTHKFLEKINMENIILRLDGAFDKLEEEINYKRK